MISRDFLQTYNGTITPEGKELVFEFFITFSRFECALINTINFRSIVNNKVYANWDVFTDEIISSFNRDKNPTLRQAVDYLVEHPPKIRYVVNNQLVWQNRNIRNNISLTKQLGLHIRTIRNNLFHGGKFNGVYQPELSRNYKLIHSSLIILNDWLTLNADVREKFLERLE